MPSMNGSEPPQTQPPAADEVEFSLFGPGFGECVIIHLGQGDWIVVDSCVEMDTGLPAALAYFGRIGVNPNDAVRLVLATHWHDDHIRGLSKVFRASPSSRLAVTLAFGMKDFQAALAPWLASSTKVESKGLGEVQQLLEICKERTSYPIHASENKILWERSGVFPAEVRSLSPSDPAVAACIARLSEIERSKFRTRLPDVEGNLASVVLSIKVGERRLLLGADLECRADRNLGWLAVVDSHRNLRRPGHHLFKIPHHGSENGHHPEIWSDLLHPNPLSALTPFMRGKKKLPAVEDRERILENTDQAYISATPRSGKFRHTNKTVQKTMQEFSRGIEVIAYEQGHVCVRGNLKDSPDSWQVSCHAGALHLSRANFDSVTNETPL